MVCTVLLMYWAATHVAPYLHTMPCRHVSGAGRKSRKAASTSWPPSCSAANSAAASSYTCTTVRLPRWYSSRISRNAGKHAGAHVLLTCTMKRSAIGKSTTTPLLPLATGVGAGRRRETVRWPRAVRRPRTGGGGHAASSGLSSAASSGLSSAASSAASKCDASLDRLASSAELRAGMSSAGELRASAMRRRLAARVARHGTACGPSRLQRLGALGSQVAAPSRLVAARW